MTGSFPFSGRSIQQLWLGKKANFGEIILETKQYERRGRKISKVNS
jgi:hypothetical protein